MVSAPCKCRPLLNTGADKEDVSGSSSPNELDQNCFNQLD